MGMANEATSPLIRIPAATTRRPPANIEKALTFSIIEVLWFQLRLIGYELAGNTRLLLNVKQLLRSLRKVKRRVKSSEPLARPYQSAPAIQL